MATVAAQPLTPPSSSKVNDWLAHLPDDWTAPAPLALPAESIDTSSRKRRRPLTDFDMNIDTPRAKRGKVISEDDRFSTSGQVASHLVTEEEDDTDETPRSRRAQDLVRPSTSNTTAPTNPAVITPISSAHIAAESSATSSISSHSAASSSAHSSSVGTRSDTSDRKRKRGDRSPVKRITTLQYAEYRVEYMSIRRWKELPGPLQPLAKSISSTAAGRRLLPADRAETLLPVLEEFDDDSELLFSDTRHLLGDAPPLSFVEHIIRHGTTNTALGRSEAAWNCNVHAPLLDQAWMSSKHQRGLRWENITAAFIEPANLLPALSAQEVYASKKADFAIVLDYSVEIGRRLAGGAVTSLGQSLSEYLRYSPITVSIETKGPDKSAESAKLQLNTWALAQITKLRELLSKVGNPTAQIPALPLLLVQGSEWKFYYLEPSETKAQLWASIFIGDTNSPRGVFKVAMALHQLMEWSEIVYRLWFENNILTPLLATI